MPIFSRGEERFECKQTGEREVTCVSEDVPADDKDTRDYEAPGSLKSEYKFLITQNGRARVKKARGRGRNTDRAMNKVKKLEKWVAQRYGNGK